MIHKLSVHDFEEPDYSLFAIHSALEDYHLAYCINRELLVKLRKNPDALEVSTKGGEAHFSRFSFHQEDEDAEWDLIQNKFEMVAAPSLGGFFDDIDISTTAFLLPEFRKVDYFLKIENSHLDTDHITDKLKQINRVSTAYEVDRDRIKSKNHLIF